MTADKFSHRPGVDIDHVIVMSLVGFVERKADRKAGNTLACETNACVWAYDRGRGIAILVDYTQGRPPFPALKTLEWSRVKTSTNWRF